MLHQARTFDILALTFVFTCLVGDFAAAAVCKLTPSGGNDRSQIINALNKCGQDGTIRFPAGNTFLLKSPISDDDYNKLSNAKIIIEGNIQYQYDDVGESDDSDIIYWEISGENVDISGSGTIKGGGQQWWNAQQHGPKLMSLKVDHGSLVDLTFNDGPSHVLVVGGTHFTVDGVTIHSVSNNYDDAYPMNTDGINVNGQHITIQNTDIIGGDDCISFLDKSDDIYVNKVRCGGPTHGISVGNLGSSSGSKEGTVKNIVVENIEYYGGGLKELGWPEYNAPQYLARIKTYANPDDTGTVSNITWRHIRAPHGVSESGKAPVFITQNHDAKEGSNEQTPGNSGIKIQDITFSDIHGGDVINEEDFGAVTIVCSKAHHCSNIKFKDIVFDNTVDKHCQFVQGLNDDCE